VKKVFKILPLIQLGGSNKLPSNSQILMQRIKQDEILVQNLDGDFNISLDADNNKITIEITNFKLNDALIMYDDSGIAQKKVIHADRDQDLQGR
jgi:hypothetical protein